MNKSLEDIAMFLQHLIVLPEWSHGVYVDHRPSRYFHRDLRDLITKRNLTFPVKYWSDKIKIADRYIYVVHPDTRRLRNATCGRELQIIGVSPYTDINRDDKLFLQTRLRGRRYNKEYSVKALKL